MAAGPDWVGKRCKVQAGGIVAFAWQAPKARPRRLFDTGAAGSSQEVLACICSLP